MPAGVPGTEIEWVRRHIARLARDQLVIATRDVTGTRLEEAGDTALRRIALAIAERRELRRRPRPGGRGRRSGCWAATRPSVLRLEDGARAGQAGVDLGLPAWAPAGQAAGSPSTPNGPSTSTTSTSTRTTTTRPERSSPAASPRRPPRRSARGRTGRGASCSVRARRRHGLRRAMIGRLAGLADLARLAVRQRRVARPRLPARPHRRADRPAEPPRVRRAPLGRGRPCPPRRQPAGPRDPRPRRLRGCQRPLCQRNRRPLAVRRR